MRDRVGKVPADVFAAAWNGAGTLDEAAAWVKVLAGSNVPRWAVMARAGELRRAGVTLKPLAPAPRPQTADARAASRQP